MAAHHPLPHRNFTHLADIQDRPGFLKRWERVRHRQAHWLVECIAEFAGVFLYVFAGVGSTAAFVLGNIAGETLSCMCILLSGAPTIFQIGMAYSIGIVLAIILCSGTSGGQFNPAVTISMVIFRKFPPLKALRYIVAQILGGYVACLLIYVQYRHLILEVSEALEAAGKLDAVNFTPNGPAGIFALYVLPGSSLGQVLLNEFVCDFMIAVTIWACIDPTNFMATPAVAPWVIALSYGIAIWGYSPVGLSANAARDLGGRLMALTIWGSKASGGNYAALAALTNIPATILGILFYEVVLADYSRVVTPVHVDYLAGHQAHLEHKEHHQMSRRENGGNSSPYSEDNDKAHVESIERV
ncbi:aquaporin-like protein [Panus rudis PR-1116 ss-1]|nr:aquaporin-like protein [Panus rudis PR-1116 ss-1]